MSEKENFVSRWSRLKRQAETEPEPKPVEAAPPIAAEVAPIELPPVESLTMDSDFSVFMRPEVDESLRRTALRKLLRDPHFNVMDGLDVYIDDYGKPDPIPAAMLSQLAVVKRMFQNRSDADRKDEQAERDDGMSRVDVAKAKPDSAPPPEITSEASEPIKAAPVDSEPKPAKEA